MRKSPPRARSPTVLRILLRSGFGAKCGAPHFAPLLPNTQILFDSAADLWSQRIPAAIRIVRTESVSAVQLFMAQVAIVNFFNAVLWFDDIGSAVAALFASGWQRKLEFRGQFSMPNLTIPELRRACNSPDTDGLAKVSQIINAASGAANRPLDTTLQKIVNQLVSRRHA